jgi:TonB family protein
MTTPDFAIAIMAAGKGTRLKNADSNSSLSVPSAFLLLCLLAIAKVSLSQQPNTQTTIALSESDARQHLIQISQPVYPPIAKAARVEGNVEIAIVIGTTGQITSEKVVSGPSMLRQAALDAVETWQFSPFRSNDTVLSASTTLIIPFQLEKGPIEPSVEQAKAAQAWFPLSKKCRDSLKTQNIADSLEYCKQALEMSLKAGDVTSSDQLAMLDSHQSYGHALLLARKPQEALAEENRAVDVAKAHLKDTDQEYAMPFYWRAMVETALGQGDAALTDLGIAEETHRNAIKHLPDMKEAYSRYLASILRQHATLLDQMGRSADAAKLRAEAASL